MAATKDQLFDSLKASLGETRVHRQRHLPFRGHPGNVYFLPRRPTDVEMARCSSMAHAEVALMRMNSAWILKIGSQGTAAATLLIPEKDSDGDITSFEWIAHVHPTEMRSQYEDVSPGPTKADFNALRTLHERWAQTSSCMIYSDQGKVQSKVTFYPDGSVKRR